MDFKRGLGIAILTYIILVIIAIISMLTLGIDIMQARYSNSFFTILLFITILLLVFFALSFLLHFLITKLIKYVKKSR
ncbi:MAG TPA: hypothetical protein VJK51_03980 [Candidatus Nanoarchaeia archaeon]|nr:hypothetical protein [Candidatus Nanoarchaeia archaeon]